MAFSKFRVVVCLLHCSILLETAPALAPLSNVNNKDAHWTRREWFEKNMKAAIISTGFSNLFISPQLSYADPSMSPPTTKPPYLLSEYFQPAATAPEKGRSYFPTLTPPFRNRATYRYKLGRNAWAFEQLLTFANVSATIRCNVIQLEETGGLWVHSPQWPTGELCYLLEDLGKPIEHIVLPCNALEHKAPMKDFIQKYPQAQVWISPGQYGPFGSCGLTTTDKQTTLSMGYRVDGILGDDMDNPPCWLKEFDMATLYVDIPRNAGPVSEVAFCHKPTKTLVATDAVVYIPTEASTIFTTYFSQREVQDPTFWPRTVLQAVFLPLRTDNDDDGSNYYPGYQALENRLVRAPILRAFADARAPNEVREWVSKISTFDFNRIITSHFASPIAASPADFASCFSYLSNTTGEERQKTTLPPIVCQDWELLEGLNQIIAQYNLGAPTTFDYKKDCHLYK